MIKIDLGKYISKVILDTLKDDGRFISIAIEAVLKEQGHLANNEVRLVTKTGCNLLPSYQKGYGREENITTFKERCKRFDSYFMIFPTKLIGVYVICSVPSNLISKTEGKLSLKECKNICSSLDSEARVWLL